MPRRHVQADERDRGVHELHGERELVVGQQKRQRLLV
jgi:hypothetical protein